MKYKMKGEQKFLKDGDLIQYTKEEKLVGRHCTIFSKITFDSGNDVLIKALIDDDIIEAVQEKKDKRESLEGYMARYCVKHCLNALEIKKYMQLLDKTADKMTVLDIYESILIDIMNEDKIFLKSRGGLITYNISYDFRVSKHYNSREEDEPIERVFSFIDEADAIYATELLKRKLKELEND